MNSAMSAGTNHRVNRVPFRISALVLMYPGHSSPRARIAEDGRKLRQD
jgi:hypothetical protein